MMITTVRLTFDRGTILVSGPPGSDEAARLPGVVWDPRVGAHRAPAFKHGEILEALAGRGVRVEDEVRARAPGPRAWGPVDLRPYQEAALCAWELGGRRGVVVLPTGSGKTRVALAAMARTGLTALCLVPTRVLLDQWRGELAKAYGAPVACMGDGFRELGPLTVATFESGWRHMARIGNRFDLLVVDEAHHFGADAGAETLEMAIAGARLGLTATPPRGGKAAEALAELVGPTVYELTIGDLTGSFLAAFDSIVLNLDLSREERRAYRADLTAFREVLGRFREAVPEGTWADFARAAGKSTAGREALAAYRRVRRLLAFTKAKAGALAALLERHRAGRVLVFTADNETAYEIARRHLVMPLTCNIARREREEAVAAFRRGELRALVSARVLNEGFDVPDADVAIVVGGALGEREHVQRVGRLLRPAPGKRAIVYELVTRGTIEVRHSERRRAGLGARAAAAT